MRPSILNPLFAAAASCPASGRPFRPLSSRPLPLRSLCEPPRSQWKPRASFRSGGGREGYILNSLCRQPHIIYFGSQGGGCSLNHFSTSGVLAYAGNWLNGSGLRPINIAGNCTFGNGFSLLCPQTLIPALANARTIVSAKPPGPALGNSYRRRRVKHFGTIERKADAGGTTPAAPRLTPAVVRSPSQS
jgi:hypothetical protein